MVRANPKGMLKIKLLQFQAFSRTHADPLEWKNSLVGVLVNQLKLKDK